MEKNSQYEKFKGKMNCYAFEVRHSSALAAW